MTAGAKELSMHVCLVTASLARAGGAEAVLISNARALAKQGHKVSLVCLDSQFTMEEVQDWLNGTFVVVQHAGFSRYLNGRHQKSVATAMRLLRLLFSRGLSRLLADEVSRLEPDIIHTHKVRGLPRNIWKTLASASRCPLVHSCHDIELINPVSSWRSASAHERSRILQRIWCALFRRPTQVIDRVFFPSNFMRNCHDRLGLFNSVVANVLPPPVTPTVHPAADNKGPRDEQLRLLFLGRLSAEKGVLELVKAVIEVNQERQRLSLNVVGEGPLVKVIHDLAQGDSAITMHGFASGAEKEAFFASADVLVVPSMCDEAYGMVAAEALARKVAVLASRRGGLPELIEHHRNGWLFEFDQPQDLAAALHVVIAERHLINEFNQSGSPQLVLHSPESCALELAGHYRELIRVQ